MAIDVELINKLVFQYFIDGARENYRNFMIDDNNLITEYTVGSGLGASDISVFVQYKEILVCRDVLCMIPDTISVTGIPALHEEKQTLYAQNAIVNDLTPDCTIIRYNPNAVVIKEIPYITGHSVYDSILSHMIPVVIRYSRDERTGRILKTKLYKSHDAEEFVKRDPLRNDASVYIKYSTKNSNVVITKNEMYDVVEGAYSTTFDSSGRAGIAINFVYDMLMGHPSGVNNFKHTYVFNKITDSEIYCSEIVTVIDPKNPTRNYMVQQNSIFELAEDGTIKTIKFLEGGMGSDISSIITAVVSNDGNGLRLKNDPVSEEDKY